MEKKNGHFTLNCLKGIILLIKTSKKSLITIIKTRNIYNEENFEQRQKMKIRKISLIDFIHQIKTENLLYNEIIENKIIFVEPINSWKNYGLKSNAHSISLYKTLMNISINDFSFTEKTINSLVNRIKNKIKKVKGTGSSTFCALFFDKELNKMISVSVGNILYSILRENYSRKYEIIYISTEQYHDINIPFQISSLNHDYNNLSFQFHKININDIIIISNNKKMIIDSYEYINNGNQNNCNYFSEMEKNKNVYLAEYKIINERNIELINDNLSIFSTSQDS